MASPYGANGQMTMTMHNYRPRQFHRPSNGENPSSSYRDMGSTSLAAARPTARPTARTVMTIPVQPGGLRGKKCFPFTVGTPYNTNVGVQKIPDRAIWKPVVAKRNNTNPWSCSKPQILVTRDSRQVHMAEQPASHHRLGSKFLPSCIHHRLPDNSLISVNL